MSRRVVTQLTVSGCVCVKVQGGRGGTSAVKSCDYTLSVLEALTRFTCLLELRWYPGLQDRLSICHWSQMSPVKQLCIGPSQSQSLGAAAWPNFCCVCVCVCACKSVLCVLCICVWGQSKLEFCCLQLHALTSLLAQLVCDKAGSHKLEGQL